VTARKLAMEWANCTGVRSHPPFDLASLSSFFFCTDQPFRSPSVCPFILLFRFGFNPFADIDLIIWTRLSTILIVLAVSENRQVLGLVGSSIDLPCLFATDSEALEADRTALVASDRNRSPAEGRQATRPRLDLNHTFDSVRLVLFYKESIKSGPIYSIDSRFASQFSAARHFAAPSFQNRLSVEGQHTINVPDSTSAGNDASSQPGIRLRISALKPADAGEYKCRVDFRRGRTLTTHVGLKVIGNVRQIDI
jgi:hypothetical protein